MPGRNSSPQKGFTILEVIIVMAIAGLIMTLVFQVIPSLIRSSRNSQRRADVATILEAVSHYELNHGGGIPANNTQLGNPKLTYYDTSKVNINVGSRSPQPNEGPVTSTDQVEIYNYQKCDSSANGRSKYLGAGFNDVVALYAIETSGGSAGECQQL